MGDRSSTASDSAARKKVGDVTIASVAPNYIVWGTAADWSSSYYIVWGTTMQSPEGEYIVWGTGDSSDEYTVRGTNVARGWRAYLTTDEDDPAVAIVYCPECAEREFGINLLNEG